MKTNYKTYKARVAICRYGSKCKLKILEASTIEELDTMINKVRQSAKTSKVHVTYLTN